jgi:ferredoxin
MMRSVASGDVGLLEGPDLARLFDALRSRGYDIVGPCVRDGTIVYDTLAGVDDLPRGVGDEQEGGRYRLTQRGDEAYFGFNLPAHSWKRFLQPPVVTLWKARRNSSGFDFTRDGAEAPRYAFLGVRPCELAAVAAQDRVLRDGPFQDPAYCERRRRAFFVANQCGVAARTCFCASLETGPRATRGFDLALTELLEGGHRFLVEVGSERGAEVAAQLELRQPEAADREAAEEVTARARRALVRQLDTRGLRELLYRRYESPRWELVAKRCLTCGNCTLVCPTCFCTSVEDVSDLAGAAAERRQRWDSCFSTDFSYIHGGSVRSSAAARYRQWLTHKLGTWQDQFGSLGCVGCGRCITWCPVGIDLTEEAALLRSEDAKGATR